MMLELLEISGAFLKIGRMWVIPQDAERPIDGRVTGEYKDWRKKNI